MNSLKGGKIWSKDVIVHLLPKFTPQLLYFAELPVLPHSLPQLAISVLRIYPQYMTFRNSDPHHNLLIRSGNNFTLALLVKNTMFAIK